jgi:hypothetical protein
MVVVVGNMFDDYNRMVNISYNFGMLNEMLMLIKDVGEMMMILIYEFDLKLFEII